MDEQRVSAEVSKIVTIVLCTKTTIKLTSQSNNALQRTTSPSSPDQADSECPLRLILLTGLLDMSASSLSLAYTGISMMIPGQ